MLVAMNRNDTIDFNNHYKLLSMEPKRAAKADPAENGGNEIQPTEYDVLFGRGKVRSQRQQKAKSANRTLC